MELTVAKFLKADEDKIARHVTMLNKTLAEAQRGQFETMLVVGLTYDGDIIQRWTEADNLVLLIGHLERAKHLVQRRLDGTAEGEIMPTEPPPAA